MQYTRTGIGTGLALLAVCGLSWIVACKEEKPAPPETLAPVEECQLAGYVAAAEGVSVRGLDDAVEIARLPAESIVSISGASAGRLRISRAVSVEEDALFSSQKGDGWIAAGYLVTGTEPAPASADSETSGSQNAEAPGEKEDGDEAGSIPVFTAARGTSIVGRLAPYDAVNILGCRGDWAYIEGTGLEGDAIRGWLSPERQCPNPVTSCS